MCNNVHEGFILMAEQIRKAHSMRVRISRRRVTLPLIIAAIGLTFMLLSVILPPSGLPGFIGGIGGYFIVIFAYIFHIGRERK